MMRDTILKIYNNAGAVVFSVFCIAFFAYLIFVAVNLVHRALNPAPKISKKEIDRDINEQW